MGGIIHAYYDCGTSPLLWNCVLGVVIYNKKVNKYSIAILILRIYAFAKNPRCPR